MFDRDALKELLEELLAANPCCSGGPDLNPGVEAKWPGRYKGKQIYAKLIEFGALPNNTYKDVAHGIDDMEWFSFSLDHSRVVHSGGQINPIVYPWTGTAPIAPTLSKSHIRINTAKDYRTSVAEVCILYTKTTDPTLD